MVSQEQDPSLVRPKILVFPDQPQEVVAPNSEDFFIAQGDAPATSVRVKPHIFGVNFVPTTIYCVDADILQVFGFPGASAVGQLCDTFFKSHILIKFLRLCYGYLAAGEACAESLVAPIVVFLDGGYDAHFRAFGKFQVLGGVPHHLVKVLVNERVNVFHTVECVVFLDPHEAGRDVGAFAHVADFFCLRGLSGSRSGSCR